MPLFILGTKPVGTNVYVDTSTTLLLRSIMAV